MALGSAGHFVYYPLVLLSLQNSPPPHTHTLAFIAEIFLFAFGLAWLVVLLRLLGSTVVLLGLFFPWETFNQQLLFAGMAFHGSNMEEISSPLFHSKSRRTVGGTLFTGPFNWILGPIYLKHGGYALKQFGCLYF